MTPRAAFVVLALAVPACFPDFQFESEKGSGTGGNDASTSSTGGNGLGGGGAGGAGGGGGPCNIFAVGECGEGQKCSIVDEAAGVPDGVGCMEAGPRPVWSRCLADAECADGL